MLSTDVFERHVLDALPVTVCTLDLDGRLTSINRAWSRFAEDTGTPALVRIDDRRGMPIWDAVRDHPAREQIEGAMDLLRNGRAPIVRWEFSRTSPEGERAFLLQMTPLHDESHAVSGFAISTVDITATHRSRDALIEAGIALAGPIDLDRVFHEVAQQARRLVRCDSLVIATTDGEPNDLQAVYRFGYEGDDRTLEQRLAPAWAGALARDDILISQADPGHELTAPMTGADGAVGAMTLLIDDLESPQKLEEIGRLVATLAAQTAAAIERVRLVDRVAHKRRLEAIGEVAAGVAHELRNPLFGISSAAQLLRFRAREDPVVEKNVGRILRETERLNRMVTALMEFGRPKTLKLSPANPDAIWDDVLETERGRLEARSLAVRRIRPESPASISVDAEQLAHVFTNILVNSVDAAPEATDITLQSMNLPNGGWRCRMTNSGPPIPPDVLPRIFEVFFSTKPGGTGIGLALCERIVRDHGGTITVDSTAESGTTVSVSLPPR